MGYLSFAVALSSGCWYLCYLEFRGFLFGVGFWVCCTLVFGLRFGFWVFWYALRLEFVTAVGLIVWRFALFWADL